MSEVNFANFNPAEHSVYDVGEGVIREMAGAFGYELTAEPDVDNLGDLIGAVGPAKTLQDNIEKVQARLGTDQDAVNIARDWVERSGLLTPVERSFMNPELEVLKDIDVAVITGGVANWMHRRADALIQRINRDGTQIGKVILAAGNRKMPDSERDDVMGGETEYIYMGDIIKPKLGKAGVIVSSVIGADSGVGGDVAEAFVEYGISSKARNVLVVSNAGAWVQNAGQIKRAMMRRLQLDEELPDNELFVISDEFPLGTGVEPAATHQNPLSALGQIARNAQEFVRHQT